MTKRPLDEWIVVKCRGTFQTEGVGAKGPTERKMASVVKVHREVAV